MESFLEEVYKSTGIRWIVVGEYSGRQSPLSVKCPNCGTIKETKQARTLLSQRTGQCKKCASKAPTVPKFTTEQFMQKIGINGVPLAEEYEVPEGEEYRGSRQPLTLRCKRCGGLRKKARAEAFTAYDCPCQRQVKREATCLERYGAKSYLETEACREAFRESNLQKYGVPHHFLNEDIQKMARETKRKNDPDGQKRISKTRETKHEKYGEVLLSPEGILATSSRTEFLLYIDRLTTELGEPPHIGLIANRFGYANSSSIGHFIRKFNIPLEKFATAGSGEQQELVAFIRSLLPEERIVENFRLPNRKQLDIYLPDRQIAFEYHGLFWHASNFSLSGGSPRPKNYHKEKREAAEEAGIYLVQIFSDEWKNKREIVQNKIKAILKVPRAAIGARKCVVREVPSLEARDFLERYHIQGYLSASTRLGLYYGEELVAIMTFRKEPGGIQLSRYATQKWQVWGGFSKLLAEAKKRFGDVIITTFADLRWSSPSSNIYRLNHFELLGITPPDYFYFKKDFRWSRRMFQKHILLKKFPEVDPNMTEIEIMTAKGYGQIYDAGNAKYQIDLSKIQ